MKNFLLGIKDAIKKENRILYFSLLGVLLVLLALDIVTKYVAFVNLSAIPGKMVLDAVPGIFNFVLVGNKGAAWGMLEDQKWVLTLISFVIGSAVLLLYLCRFEKMPVFIRVLLVLIVAGAYGNLIDRIGYWAQLGIYKDGVVDFLQFAFFDSFPVFNLADSYLTVGLVLLLVYYAVVGVREGIEKREGKKDEVDVDALKAIQTDDGKADATKEEEHGKEDRH